MTFFKKTPEYIRNIINLRDHIDVEKAADNIQGNIYFRGPNVYILFCAIIIASLGLNVNSIPVIIGAMLISPLMGPIVGFGLALGTNNTQMLRSSLSNLLVMVCISIVASTLYFILTPLRLENPSELLARTNPTIYDVMIAFFGGLAGILETSRRDKGTVLAGVAIATALMPPLCTIGFGISQLNLSYAVGALYLFFINSTFIALASFVGVKYLRFPQKKYQDPATQRRRHRFIILILIIITIPSILSAISIVKENNFDRSVDSFISNLRKTDITYVYDQHIDHSQKVPTLEIFVAGRNLDTVDYKIIYALAEEQGIMRNQLTINTNALGNGLTPDKEEFLSNTLRRINEIQREKDSVISVMQQELDTYHNKDIATTQIAAEIRIIYPQIGDITLSHGSTVDSDGEENEVIIAIVEAKNKMTKTDIEKLEQWLSARLDNRKVKVVCQ